MLIRVSFSVYWSCFWNSIGFAHLVTSNVPRNRDLSGFSILSSGLLLSQMKIHRSIKIGIFLREIKFSKLKMENLRSKHELMTGEKNYRQILVYCPEMGRERNGTRKWIPVPERFSSFDSRSPSKITTLQGPILRSSREKFLSGSVLLG